MVFRFGKVDNVRDPGLRIMIALVDKMCKVRLRTASGFSGNEALVVTECAPKGARTGAGDCNLTGMQSVTSDANGTVRADFTVDQGPFGANKVTCGPSQACLVSVTQASLSPTQEADERITFAGGS